MRPFASLAARLGSETPPDPAELDAAYGPALVEARRLVAKGLLTADLPDNGGVAPSEVTAKEPVPPSEVSDDESVPPSQDTEDDGEPQTEESAAPNERATTGNPLAGYKIHPVAAIFPLMVGKARAEFGADIKKNGLREPIVTHLGEVADGRNRLIGCIDAGVEPRFVEWTGTGSIVDWIISINIHRRHLTDQQRAMIAAKVAEVMAVDGRRRSAQNLRNSGSHTENLDPESRAHGSSAEMAARMLNVSKDATAKAAAVLKKGSTGLIEAVKSGNVSLDAASKVATLPHQKQEEVLTKGKAKETAKAIRDARTTAASDTKSRKTAGPKKDELVVSAHTTEVLAAQGSKPVAFPLADSSPVEDQQPNKSGTSTADAFPVLKRLHGALEALILAAQGVGKMARAEHILTKMIEVVDGYRIDIDPTS